MVFSPPTTTTTVHLNSKGEQHSKSHLLGKCPASELAFPADSVFHKILSEMLELYSGFTDS